MQHYIERAFDVKYKHEALIYCSLVVHSSPMQYTANNNTKTNLLHIVHEHTCIHTLLIPNCC